MTPATNFYKFVKLVKGETIADKKNCNRMVNCFGGGLDISEIDLTAIRKIVAHEKGRQMAHNTIHNFLKWFRRVMALAKKEGIIKSNPFDDYDMPKYKQSERFFLIKEEREKWLKEWLSPKKINDPSLYRTMTYFLIGTYTGLRHSDWHKINSMVHGKFVRLRAKKNNEWVVVPVGKTLDKLIKTAKALPPPFSGDKSRDHLKIIAGLLESNVKVTTHVARHSFGAMCAELRLPKSVTAELMGITVQTVEVYYHLTGQNIIDQASALKNI
jgi:site-specific recombinase XerD